MFHVWKLLNRTFNQKDLITRKTVCKSIIMDGDWLMVMIVLDLWNWSDVEISQKGQRNCTLLDPCCTTALDLSNELSEFWLSIASGGPLCFLCIDWKTSTFPKNKEKKKRGYPSEWSVVYLRYEGLRTEWTCKWRGESRGDGIFQPCLSPEVLHLLSLA